MKTADLKSVSDAFQLAFRQDILYDGAIGDSLRKQLRDELKSTFVKSLATGSSRNF
jgi:hypothetical protein